jgi:adenosylmethionine-8-amino-7-oxononanoate aminotransferase
MVGIELVKNRITREPFAPEDKMGHRVALECRKLGLLIRPLGDVVVIMPPLSISLPELKKLVEIVHAAVRTVTEKA